MVCVCVWGGGVGGVGEGGGGGVRVASEGFKIPKVCRYLLNVLLQSE